MVPETPAVVAIVTPDESSTAAPATLSATTHSPAAQTTLQIGGCVAPDTGESFKPVELSQMSEAILAFLNAGGQVGDLPGVSGKPQEAYSGDIDGDGSPDLVVPILDAASDAVPPAGVLAVYLCRSNSYSLVFQQKMAGSPHVWLLQDLDADGRPDLLAGEATCGAHTCFEAASLWSWDGSQLVNRLEGTSSDLPNPLIAVKDPDGDGVFRLEVTGTGVSSVGAGPPRAETWIWKYDLEKWGWVMSETNLAESNYRIHILQDADDAARNGGFEQALILYQRVAGDPSLKDWVDPAAEKADLGAYARYRMFLIYAVLNQADRAELVYNDLAASYPAGVPQHDYVALADLFRDGFSQSGLEGGCSAVQSQGAATIEALLAALNSFGYKSPVFNLQDFCLP